MVCISPKLVDECNICGLGKSDSVLWLGYDDRKEKQQTAGSQFAVVWDRSGSLMEGGYMQVSFFFDSRQLLI